MTGPFNEAAAALHMAGWHPLPVPPNKKAPVPAGTTGHEGTNLDEIVIEFTTNFGYAPWEHTTPQPYNVATRAPDGVIGLDVDQYGPKRGWQQLQQHIAETGLPPLPETWISTSRPTTESGIYWFQVPPGLHWRANPLPNMETIQHTHRYAIMPPSIHPTGATYTWRNEETGETTAEPPRLDQLPQLPDEWVAELRHDIQNTRGRPFHTWESKDPDGPMHPLVQAAVDKFIRSLDLEPATQNSKP